ncbi:MAG: hypothetical protein ACK5K7_06945 [Bacilli bacterium]
MSDLKRIYASLDIGTNYIKAVVAEVYEGRMFVLASSMITSDGIVDGVIEDEESVVVKVKEVINELSSMIGVEINKVVLGLPAYNVAITKLYGETYITNETGIIRGEDLQRAIVDATKKYNVEGNEIVNAIPLRYNIDGYVYDDAIGSEANKLGVELLVLATPANIIYPYLTVAEKSDLEVMDICLSPLADKYEVLNDMDYDSAIIINIGFSQTSMLISNNNELKGIGTFGIGLKKIVESLVTKFEIHPVSALEFINNYGIDHTINLSETIKLKSLENNEVEFVLEELVTYLEHVMISLLVSFKQEVEKYDLELYDKVVITGGSVEITGFDVLCNRVFNNNSELYKPKYIGARKSGYTTTFGLIRYIVDKNNIRGRYDSSLDQDLQMKISTPKKKIINLPEDSVLSKLIEYFF